MEGHSSGTDNPGLVPNQPPQAPPAQSLVNDRAVVLRIPWVLQTRSLSPFWWDRSISDLCVETPPALPSPKTFLGSLSQKKKKKAATSHGQALSLLPALYQVDFLAQISHFSSNYSFLHWQSFQPHEFSLEGESRTSPEPRAGNTPQIPVSCHTVPPCVLPPPPGARTAGSGEDLPPNLR